MRLDEMFQTIKSTLEEAGIPECENEARIILREYAGADRGMLFAHPETAISDDACFQINNCLKRRLMREPLQYILGEWDFMGLSFLVEKNVLIPRPDTEILVECALQYLHDGMKILDLCTGTGCVLISLLHYSNDCVGTAVDISDHALALAEKNSQRLLADKDEFPKIIKSDLYDSVDGIYDMIVSNPPYINSDVIVTLESEVKDYEPHLALDGGTDGLDLIRRIIDESNNHLCRGGTLLMEIGYDQGERVCELMTAAGFIDVECVKDYAGNDRVVKGIRPVL